MKQNTLNRRSIYKVTDGVKKLKNGTYKIVMDGKTQAGTYTSYSDAYFFYELFYEGQQNDW